MKKLIILIAMLILLAVEVYGAGSVIIDGYITVCSAFACHGEVRLYRTSTGGSPIGVSCISPNGYYRFEYESLDTGTYYIEVYNAWTDDYSECIGREHPPGKKTRIKKWVSPW